MKTPVPIMRWREFVVGLGYWKASFLHAFVFLPLIFLTFWIIVLDALSEAFDAQHSVSLSTIIAGPLIALWTIPPLVLGFFVWPLCLMGTSENYGEVHSTDHAKNKVQSAEQVVAPNRSVPPTQKSTSPVRGPED